MPFLSHLHIYMIKSCLNHHNINSTMESSNAVGPIATAPMVCSPQLSLQEQHQQFLQWQEFQQWQAAQQQQQRPSQYLTFNGMINNNNNTMPQQPFSASLQSGYPPQNDSANIQQPAGTGGVPLQPYSPMPQTAVSSSSQQQQQQALPNSTSPVTTATPAASASSAPSSTSTSNKESSGGGCDLLGGMSSITTFINSFNSNGTKLLASLAASGKEVKQFMSLAKTCGA